MIVVKDDGCEESKGSGAGWVGGGDAVVADIYKWQADVVGQGN